MALRQRFHPNRTSVSSDVKKIRAKFLEAKRAGASTKDASDYANGKIDHIIKPAPQAAPVERERLIPEAWTAEPKLPPSPEDGTEVRKRGTLSLKPTAAPEVQVAVDAAPEIVAEVVPPAKPAIPPDFDVPTFPWQQLRALATSMGCSANGRADAVASIKSKLVADAKSPTTPDEPA